MKPDFKKCADAIARLNSETDSHWWENGMKRMSAALGSHDTLQSTDHIGAEMHDNDREPERFDGMA